MLTRKLELTHEEIVVLYYQLIDSNIRLADYGFHNHGEYDAANNSLRNKIMGLMGKGKAPKPKIEDIWNAVKGTVGRT